MRRNSRLEFSEETKLNADAQASTEYYSKKLEGGSNFISEVFFLSVAAHHYGTGAAEESYKNLGKDLETMEGHLTYLLETRVKWLNVRFPGPYSLLWLTMNFIDTTTAFI